MLKRALVMFISHALFSLITCLIIWLRERIIVFLTILRILAFNKVYHSRFSFQIFVQPKIFKMHQYLLLPTSFSLVQSTIRKPLHTKNPHKFTAQRFPIYEFLSKLKTCTSPENVVSVFSSSSQNRIL